MQSDLPRVVEVLHDLLREHVGVLDLEQLLRREILLGVVVERLEDLVEDLGVESSHEGPLLDGHLIVFGWSKPGRPRAGLTASTVAQTPNSSERSKPQS